MKAEKEGEGGGEGKGRGRGGGGREERRGIPPTSSFASSGMSFTTSLLLLKNSVSLCALTEMARCRTLILC